MRFWTAMIVLKFVLNERLGIVNEFFFNLGFNKLYSPFFVSFFKKILFRVRGREGEREGEKEQHVAASHAPPTRDPACNPGMCPGWEPNQGLLGSQAVTQSTELHPLGLLFLIGIVFSSLIRGQCFLYYDIGLFLTYDELICHVLELAHLSICFIYCKLFSDKELFSLNA